MIDVITSDNASHYHVVNFYAIPRKLPVSSIREHICENLEAIYIFVIYNILTVDLF